jgi:predicted CoA-substrate-specific enzyme activase
MAPYREDQGTSSCQLYAGIDAGSVSVNGILIDAQKRIIHESPYQRHFGKVEETVAALVDELFAQFGRERIAGVAFTGSHGKLLSERVGAHYEFEIISQVLGAVHIRPDVRTVIAMGGQDTALMQICHTASGWELEFFNTNGPCASGTGSFIDQQAERLAIAMYERRGEHSHRPVDRILADFIALGLKSRQPASVACRCTVFTKSDMIHLQNKGERLEEIIHGLHVGNARNYLSTIVSNRALHDPILFIGGLSLNRLQVKALQDYFPGLEVPPRSTSIGALGAALHGLALGSTAKVDPADLTDPCRHRATPVPVGLKLELRQTVFPENNDVPLRPVVRRLRGTLGIDIGSTSTKYALIDERGQIVHKRYIPTQGKPVEAVQGLLEHLHAQLGSGLEITGVATTGSGRNVVGDFLRADLIIDEITAHARGAVAIDPTVDTIFEIGGQDSKYISIGSTHPLDFDMNKVCAAGTGSFLHELANKHGIDIVGEFQEIALASEKPVKLAERCTVFMESDLMSYHQKGSAREDLIAGLCYAIVHNYLNRVVGKRRIGERVMFLGGPSLNQAVVAAFENVLGRGLLVPKHREVLGAFGAAVCLQESMRAAPGRQSLFRGIESAIADRMDHVEKVCRVDPRCHNQCKLKIYQFGERRSVWGGECGRYETARRDVVRREDFFALRRHIWEEHMAGVYETLPGSPRMEADGRPTVGMLRALYGLQASVLWAHFFDRLGFRLVLTPPTDEEISKKGIEAMLAETCFPVKVSHGHARALVGKTRHLFMPTPVDMATPNPAERGYYCPMVQGNTFMIRAALGIDSASVLNPCLRLKSDPDVLALDLHEQMGGRLGVGKPQLRGALRHAMEKQKQFVEALHRRGAEAMRSHRPDEPLVVVTGRPYNLYDERMNLRLGQSLAKIGVTALPMDFIDVSGVDLAEFSSMYWGLGAQVLRTAKLISAAPHCFGLHLTNFGCGADSFIEHFYKHIMGGKASLILELDEHSAAAGVMTRLEAYRHVIANSLRKNQSPKPALRRPGRPTPQPAAAAPEETVMAVCSQ